MKKKLTWDERNEKLEDIDRIVLLLDQLGSVEYWELQRMVREKSSVFKECFKKPGDVRGAVRPTSGMLNYYLNMLEFARLVRCESGKFYKTEALERKASQIRASLM